MTQVDYVEVGRVAHELRNRHGWNADKYAAKLAAEALEDRMMEEYEFWRAVEAALTPREKSK